MERVSLLSGLTRRPAQKAYTIDFSTFYCLDHIPLVRMHCGLSGIELPFVQHVNGNSTIREIAASLAASKDTAYGSVADFQKFGRKLFQSLWRLDFVALALQNDSST